MTPITAVNVVGARPNFMKIAPLQRAMAASGRFRPFLVHTGQHYDPLLSSVFFEDLALPPPDVTLDVGSGSHAEQTAATMLRLEPVLLDLSPDVVVTVGDVNSTLGAALTAAKLCIPLAHVEAGLRSRDRTMPEEINRIVTDVLSDFLFAPSADAVDNLASEGIPPERIHLVGNIMIDSLQWSLARAGSSRIARELGLVPKGFVLATVHRPSNVDAPDALAAVVEILGEVAAHQPVVLVAHPRTMERLEGARIEGTLQARGVRVIPPLGYPDFLHLMTMATAVLTDSGGVQEESTVLGIPCITLRDRTERPITVAEGTNTVTGVDRAAVMEAFAKATRVQARPRRPPLWDGHTAERIVQILVQRLET